ncbi:Plasma membrane-associated coenzyme Q6 reductase PGA3 [Spathaspora sp. JA1]|nr:Plasma membrane-associated coenzyme Q6 reductase PGA3 [Spathaspora sp. JA1]
MEDKRELFKNPVHSIYIPIGLILFGTWIFSWEYMPYSIAFIVIVCSVKYYEAYKNRSSLDKTVWQDFELLDKTIIAPMTSIYRFKLRRDDEVLDIPTGHHVACCFNINGKDEIRYYSPISNQFDSGFFDILVKHYQQGVVTRRLAQVNEGQTVKFRGPFGKLKYEPNMARELTLIAGGTGITPILQVITRIITNPEDHTKIKLIFGNETEKDILLKSEIDEIASKYPDFEVYYTVTRPTEGWTGGSGYVTKEMLEKQASKINDGNKVFICGPPEMKESLKEITEEMGWESENVFCF